MSGDKNFPHIWDFRSKDDAIDSSTDDSESSSRGERKHKLVSAFFLEGNDESSDASGYEEIDRVKPGKSLQLRKSRTKKQLTTKVRGKNEYMTERGSRKEVGRKKRKFSALSPASLDEFKIFTESLLQELKAERERMFARMKEDIQNLVSVKSSTRQTTRTMGRKRSGQTKNSETEMRHCKCGDGISERSLLSSRIPDSDHCSKALEEQVNSHQAVQIISSHKKEKGQHMRLLANQSMYSSNQCDQFASSSSSSSQLTLPSALSEKKLELQNTDSPFRNLVKPVTVGNGNGAGLFDRGNLVMNAMNHPGYNFGRQVEVPIQSFAEMGSKNMNFHDQHYSTQTTIMRNNGFPLPLHQRLESSFNIPRQVECLSFLGWRMNGGTVKFSGNDHALPDDIASNNVRNRMH